MPAQIDHCVKGWGENIVFAADDTCPISGAKNCVSCEVGALAPEYEKDFKKLKEKG